MSKVLIYSPKCVTGLYQHTLFKGALQSSTRQILNFQNRHILGSKACRFYSSETNKNPDTHTSNFFEDLKAEGAKVIKKLGKYNEQFRVTIQNAQKKIQEANAKIKLQEEESAELKFDTDFATHKKIDNLPSRVELKRTQFARKMEFYFDSLQETIFTATRALNDVTGYSAVQKLRNSISVMEKELGNQKKMLKTCKADHETIVQNKTRTQEEINSLLQRKSSWSPADLEFFTKVYQQNQENIALEETKFKELKEMEKNTERLETDLYNAILTRYHEEQVWSDKIRRTSTWGTFLLMGVNILLFIVVQLFFEPWKRRRLVRAFEDKVKDTLDEHKIEQDERFDKLLALLEKHNSPPPINDKDHTPNSDEKQDSEVRKSDITQKIRHLFELLKHGVQTTLHNKLYIPKCASYVACKIQGYWSYLKKYWSYSTVSVLKETQLQSPSM